MTHSPLASDRRVFLVSACAIGLAGCSDLLGPPAAPQIYVVRPEFPAAATGAPTGWSLAVIRPTAPAALNTTRIAIAKPDATMDYYADAQYPDALPDLVQSALVAGFEAGGRIGGVSREADALRADYDLFVDIRDFEARYTVADGVPQAVVALTAKLVTAHGRIITGNFNTAQSVPATANSIAAATAALQQALAAAAAAVIAWASGFPAPSPTP